MSGKFSFGNKRQQDANPKAEPMKEAMNGSLSADMKENLQKIQDDMGNSQDLIIRQLETERLELRMAFVYIDGLVDNTAVSEFTIQTVLAGKGL